LGVLRHGDVGGSDAVGDVVARTFCVVLAGCRSAGRRGPAAMVMTQQYVAGELSLLLAQLRTVATNEASVRDVTGLRREAETLPPASLISVTVRAIALADRMCWDSIAQGDTAAFDRQAAASATLHEFGVCAGLLEDA
jgi:hypothetical protein